MDYKAIIFVLSAILLFGVGDFAAKLLADNTTGSLKEMIGNKKLVFSFLLMGAASTLGFLCWMMALRFGEVSKLVPLQKLSLVVTIVLATVFLHESMNWKSITATGLAVGALILLLF